MKNKVLIEWLIYDQNHDNWIRAFPVWHTISFPSHILWYSIVFITFFNSPIAKIFPRPRSLRLLPHHDTSSPIFSLLLSRWSINSSCLTIFNEPAFVFTSIHCNFSNTAPGGAISIRKTRVSNWFSNNDLTSQSRSKSKLRSIVYTNTCKWTKNLLKLQIYLL